MKKLFVLFVLGFILYGCGCLAQIPPQYVYVDDECTAIIPDYSNLVVVSDNCELADLTQIPSPGTAITVTTVIEMRAIDVSGNTSSVYFNAVLLDTVAPLIQLNPEWTGYTDTEVADMYKVYYGWVQEKGDYYNEVAAGRIDTIYAFDTMYVHTIDTMHIFYGTIPITYPEFRIDQGYWSDSSPDLTAWFNY
jgi:hypothetical protein